MEKSNPLAPPTKTVADDLQAVGKVITSLANGGDLFELFVKPPMLRRLQEWRESIGEEVNRLREANYLSEDDLQDNPKFVDAVSQATSAAA